MSTENKQIADTLREWCERYTLRKDAYDELIAIADHIDAKHERKLLDYERKFREWKHTQDTCYVELPKDADGVIWTGKETHFVDAYGEHHKLLTLEYSANISAWYLSTTLSGKYLACKCYHAEPTVEDVLHELIGKCSSLSELDGENKLVAEYAKKLQLRGDAE